MASARRRHETGRRRETRTLSVEWILTLAACVASVCTFGVAIWQSSRPRKDSLRARWVPWKFVVLLAGAVMVYALLHVLTLLGFKPRPGHPY
jgi:hypothetical protein